MAPRRRRLPRNALAVGARLRGGAGPHRQPSGQPSATEAIAESAEGAEPQETNRTAEAKLGEAEAR